MRQMRVVALSAFLTILSITGIAFAENAGRPWLGVVIEDPVRPGAVLVSEVVPGGPADLAGINPDDLITGLNGEPISGSDDLVKGIMGFKAGDKVALEVESGGNVEEIDVTLEPMPVALTEHSHGNDNDDKDREGKEGSSWSAKDHGDCKGKHGQGDGVHSREKCMHGTGMKDGSKYDKIYTKLKSLQLDAVQTTKARAIDADFRKKAVRAGAEIEVAQIELGELTEANPVNLDKVKAKLVEISSKKADITFLSIKAVEDVKKILTPEQLSEFNGGESCPLGDARHGSGD